MLPFPDDKDDWIKSYRKVIFTAPKEISLLGSTPREIPYTIASNHPFGFGDGSELSFPYLLTDGGAVLVHTNMRVGSPYGAVIRRAGNMRWFGPADYPQNMRIYIRE